MFSIVFAFEKCNLNPFMDLCGTNDRTICIDETISEKAVEKIFEDVSSQMNRNHGDIMIAASRYNSAKLFKVKDIYYIESFGKIKSINSKDETFEFYGVLDRIAPVMERFGFARIHHSYIISLRHMKRAGSRSVEMVDGKIINVGRKYLTDYRNAVNRLDITRLNDRFWQ